MAKRRVHLTFPGKLADEPILWKLSQTFDLVFNIRQADYTEGLGWMMTELEGTSANLAAGLRWLEGQGVHVAPIEQDVVH
ncbi:MAG TPA: NIL domain-containing protein [Candidatus Methylomirabilis sp.]|nr:NIL domain-containing protein [Candidatus Methylomirabilis sp.]